METVSQPWRTSLSFSASIPYTSVMGFRIQKYYAYSWKKPVRLPQICCHSSTRVDGSQKVRPPPSDYDFRAETSDGTQEMVQRLYPELMDLVEDGTLVIVKRPPDYVERRSDGYVEPEVVYIVGTAHMSKLSANQVTRVINAVQPENVVIELCRSRAGIMYDEAQTSDVKQGSKNLMSMSGDNFGSAVGRSLKLGGRSALALRLLLAGVSKRLSASAGVATGEEFRAARKAAEALGAQIVLGDRPIEITLQRAWRSLKWDERLRFGATLVQGMSDKNLNVSEESLQMLKSDDALSAMFGELSSRFPSLMQPLIHERDMYLAWSLKRSKAVNGCKRVVGVVGKGHLRGIVHALIHDQENLRFKDLVGSRGIGTENSKGEKLRKFATNLAIETVIGLLTWWAWESFQHH
ncbi:uncharacterized protein [Physcomitrium patens]|uniref:TraB family protein n=1 Tax=Physcomitrium patens TaxID=3218 RepID=A0A2K1IEV6_PHYPA|nr:traB domain-containing protein-like [Physcomitrium patens]PNR27811.1 hypothetical protein PHYPA_029963 [Physcomitrium patens]|eukprot:XP_024365398.1 traB domain-containing protein-like [Physcomitrella patens]